MKLEDRLTDDERAELLRAQAIDAARGVLTPQPTAAQRATRAEAVDALHEALKRLDSVDTCQAILTHVLARPDLAAPDLDDLGNRISREAWARDR